MDLLKSVLGHCCCKDFSLVAASGGYSSFQYMDFSLQWLRDRLILNFYNQTNRA